MGGAITLLLLFAIMACYRVNFTFVLVKHCSPVMADGLTGCHLVGGHPFLVIVSYRLVTTIPFHIEM